MIEAAKIISLIASPAVLAALMIAAAVILAVQQRRTAAKITLWLVAGNILTPLLKWLVARPRPADALVAEAGFAFPSGHALGVTLFAGALVLAAWHSGWRGGRLIAVVVLAGALAKLVGYSRLVLHVHWLSDVVGGILIGIGWVILVLVFHRRKLA